MHPVLARSGRLAMYLGVWAGVGLLLGATLVAQIGVGWQPALLVALPLTTLYASVCLSAWYVAWGMPLAATGAVRIIATALTASAVSSAAWLVAARLWVEWLSRHGSIGPLGAASAGLYTLLAAFGLLLYLLSLAVSYLIAVFEHVRVADRRALQAQVLAREAELRALRAQIDPHFLFNSLHSISALTASDAAAARQMCLLLADFLRDSLALGAAARITLGRELGLVARFLAVERIRYGDRLRHQTAVDDAAALCMVPPLLLQPLVENAITHGVAHLLTGGAIAVRAQRHGGRLVVTVENPCDPDRPRRGGAGVGLANVRARLRALHGHEAGLVAAEADGIWRVELSLPAVTELTSTAAATAGPPVVAPA